MPDRKNWDETTDSLFLPPPTRAEPKVMLSTSYKFLLHPQPLAFTLMELAFLVLAWFSFKRPVPIPYTDYSDLSTTKSGLVAIFNVWHTIAVACGLHTCFEIFSKEWVARPERTDLVSTISSGIIDRITYSFKSRATKTFRAAFLVLLLLALLRTTGSSTMTVASTTRMGSVNVNNIIGRGFNPNNLDFRSRLQRANMIAKLERLHGIATGFEPEPNWFIPLPFIDNDEETLSLAYSTDLAHFDYSCHWQLPDGVLMTPGTLSVKIGEKYWEYQDPRTNPGQPGKWNASTIIQLTVPNNGGPNNDGQENEVGGASVFLFVGGDSPSTPTDTQRDFQMKVINLSNQTTINFRDATFDTSVPPRATLLICDPQLRLTSGTVRLNPIANLNIPDIKVISENSNVHIGNVDPNTARDVFSTALSTASDPMFDYYALDNIGEDLFLLPWKREAGKSLQFTPRDLTTIERKLGVYMLSAIKAFTSGFVMTHWYASNYTITPAKYDNERLVLVTSPPFAIGHSVLFVVAWCGVAGLGFLNSTQCRPLFNLKSIEGELGKSVEGDKDEGRS